MKCIVCSLPIDYPLMRQMNGAPKLTPLCADCISAVEARQIGIVKTATGYEVTDGRKHA
jgi:hypothetical protein